MILYEIFMHSVITLIIFVLVSHPNRFSPEWLRKHEAKLETIRPLHLSPT
jgi:hypothetical protein